MTVETPVGHTIPSDDDGYTLERYIPGEEGLYPGIEVSFRPLPPRRVAEYRRRTKDHDEVEMLESACAVLAKQVVSWNAKDHKGGKMAVTYQNALILHQRIQQALSLMVIFGTYAGVVNPKRADDRDDDDGFFNTPVEFVEDSQKN